MAKYGNEFTAAGTLVEMGLTEEGDRLKKKKCVEVENQQCNPKHYLSLLNQ